MFFPSNVNISFRFTNIIFFTCTYSFVYYASWVGFLLFIRNRFLIFLVNHFILTSYKSLVSSWNFLKKRLEDVSFFLQYGTSIKIRKEYHLQKFLLQKLNHSIYLVNCFFQMLAVNFMWKPTHMAALIFLSRTFKSYKEKVLCLHLLKCWKPDRTLQNNAAILFSKKFSK